jgi:DNA-3-methyladenine glycosylase
MILKKSYYSNPDVLYIANDLLGKVLYTEINGIITSGIIVETEAYKAPEDKASHAYNNRKTERTKTMFLDGGHAYIYLCYGIHEMFNVVTGAPGTPHAVLIRAIEPLEGTETMLLRRNMKEFKSNISKGPGSLTRALGITRQFNECKLYDSKSPVRIYDERIQYNKSQIGISKRIGVQYAEESADWPYRFFVKENEYVSKLSV